MSYKMPIIFSLLLHVVILGLFFLHFPSKKQPDKQVSIIKAVAVSQSQIQPKQTPTIEPMVKKVDTISEETIRRLEQIALKQPDVRKVPIAKPVVSKPIPAPTTPAAQVPVPPPLEIKQTEEALQEPKINDQAIINWQAKKKHMEQEHKQLIKKQEQELAKKRREQEMEQLQKELEEAKNKEPKEALAKPENESADLSQIKSNLEEEMSAEKEQLAASQLQVKMQEADMGKYKAKIIQTISQKWLIPDADKNLSCQLLVHLAPGGVVVNVEVIKASGDEGLDRSARTAIMKASPLPVPESSDLFDNFRTLRLTFRPQGIISE